MKKRLTIGVIATALSATVSLVAAQPKRHLSEAAARPASDILTNVQLIGLYPTSHPYKRGPYYVLHAVDPNGTELRVVADAELGDIVSITPLFAPRFDAGPRIIHVPQPGERSSLDDRDEAALPDEEAIEESAPPPRRALRRPYHRSERHAVPPPPRPRRNVLSLPPAPTGLNAIQPTPEISDKLDAKAEAEKFRAPEESDRLRPPPGSASAVEPKQD